MSVCRLNGPYTLTLHLFPSLVHLFTLRTPILRHSDIPMFPSSLILTAGLSFMPSCPTLRLKMLALHPFTFHPFIIPGSVLVSCCISACTVISHSLLLVFGSSKIGVGNSGVVKSLSCFLEKKILDMRKKKKAREIKAHCGRTQKKLPSKNPGIEKKPTA